MNKRTQAKLPQAMTKFQHSHKYLLSKQNHQMSRFLKVHNKVYLKHTMLQLPRPVRPQPSIFLLLRQLSKMNFPHLDLTTMTS
mmetsp:Transcript_122014/g.350580  ORF Transcript_122014/g.350580 Transcript_122014/m.350580 type:complete len:83 (-) Transcript_122014:143-391(-)